MTAASRSVPRRNNRTGPQLVRLALERLREPIMECQRARVPSPDGLRYIALITVNESRGSIGPKEQPISVEPGIRHRDFARSFEILVQELSSALSAKRTLRAARQKEI